MCCSSDLYIYSPRTVGSTWLFFPSHFDLNSSRLNRFMQLVACLKKVIASKRENNYFLISSLYFSKCFITFFKCDGCGICSLQTFHLYFLSLYQSFCGMKNDSHSKFLCLPQELQHWGNFLIYKTFYRALLALSFHIPWTTFRT